MVLIAGIALYFYLGNFFQTGVDYYGNFMHEQNGIKGLTSQYIGRTEYGETEIHLTTMKITDKLIEVSQDGESSEYVMESSEDGQKIRLFDSNNLVIFSGLLDREKGILTTSAGDTISYYGYKAATNEKYSAKNPDPILLVILANRLNERYRGNLSMLIFSALILSSLMVDVFFPKFFFRLKNLKFKGEVELPAMYTKMQKYSWMISPVLIIIFLFMAI